MIKITNKYFNNELKLIKTTRKLKDKIIPYETNLVNDVIKDICLVFNQVEDIIRILSTKTTFDEDQLKNLFLLHQLRILHCKRCLLAYHNDRIKRINKLLLKKDENLTTLEEEFVKESKSITNEYNNNNNSEVFYNQKPPKDLFIFVRVIKDIQTVVYTQNGELTLITGCVYYLKREDIDEFLKLGFLHEV